MNKKFLIVSGAVASLAVAGLGSGMAVHAYDEGSAHHAASGAHKQHAATKKKVTKKHESVDKKLETAVKDGVITEDQKTAFLAEWKQLESARKSAISASTDKAGRTAARDKFTSDLKAWAGQNNFPLGKVFPKLAQ